MKCPICKKTIPDNSLKCPYCKTRTGLICKNCHTVNTIFDITCKKCGEEILKLCPECSCVNFPNAVLCRKCGYKFEEPVKIHRIAPKNSEPNKEKVEALSQEDIEKILPQILLTGGKKIISLSGSRGVGKSFVLARVINKLKDKQFVWFYGKCTPITQLTPGGLIQDIIFNLFNLPNFCINSNKFKKDATKLFRNKFPYLSNEEIADFLNFLYPSVFGFFEDIAERKTKTYNFLNKIFDNIILYSKFVIVVDNFDSIDGLSYEFLHNYVKKDSVFKDLKLLLIYSDAKPSKGYFNFSENGNDDIYFDMRLAPFNRVKMMQFLQQKQSKNSEFPEMDDAERELVLAQSLGNPAYIEQACGLRLDSQIADRPFELPQSYEDLVAKRICFLSVINKEAYTFIMGSAILGDKINLNLVKQIFDYSDEQFENIITYLQKMNFIAPLNDIFYQFKDLLLWETILNVAKNDEQYVQLNTKVCNALENFTPNSNAIFGIIAQNIKNPRLALDIWTRNTRLSAYIGDMSLYSISQKQCLALINELDETSTLKIRYNISERLGKLLTDYNPSEAMDYLPDAIANARALNDIPREIELLGYMTKCCRQSGNYLGNVECVDSVLEILDPQKKLETVFVKCSKLQSLLAIGNCGQIINMIDTEILPVFEEILGQPYTRTDFSVPFVIETWLKVYLVLARALVMQGNDRSFEILTVLFDILERNNYQDEQFICRCKLTLAMADTMKGDFTASEKILEEIMKQYEADGMDEESVVYWNSINIINNFLRRKYKDIQQDLFHVVTYANNCGDNFTKNVMKSLLGKFFKDGDKVKQAMDIYNDQIAYFSKEKMALGALLTWYLIADATLVTEGPYAAFEIASQALEVAQNPKIDNYFFAVLMRIVMAKCNMATSDYDSAKMHIETAIEIARKYNMNDLLSRLYLLYGKYLQEMGLARSPKQRDYLAGAKKMFDYASDLVRQTRNNHVHFQIEEAKNVFRSFTAVNGIKV